MENERLLFKFYKSYFDTAKMLDDKNRLKFYDALFEKQFNFIEPSLDGLANLVWVSQKHSIDAQVNGWLDKMKSMGIQPPTAPPIQPPCIQLKEKEKEKEKEEVKEKEEIKMSHKATIINKSFIIPTVLEIIEYCISRGNDVSGQKFFDFYESKGWLVGKNKMKDWKAAVRTWEKTNNIKSTSFTHVKYKIDNETVTHTRKAYEENLSIYGKERVIFIKEVE